MEALVFRYFTTAAGSLWAWVAVLAAALSYWLFLSVGSKPTTTTLRPAPPLTSPNPQQPNSPTLCVEPSHKLPAIIGDGGGDLKGRYTAYFKVEEWGDDADSAGAGVASVKARRHEGLVMRRGDLGWYRYQDLSVLNGSIVRLWDGELPAPVVGCSGRMVI